MTCSAVHEEFARRAKARAIAEEQVAQAPQRQCRVCGCTDEWGCLVPGDRSAPFDYCAWVEDDLCSACAEPAREVVTVEVTAGVL